MHPEPSPRSRIASRIPAITEEMDRLIALVDRPEVAETLTDRELLTLAAWTEGRNETVAAECRRRADQARLYAAYRDDVEAVAIRAERIRP
jgi:hypothetical protein